ncbi:MAG: hypothetical protein JWR09_3458 [Mucilaginibacter sp.]|nr:hypothetical protein [Mucilaginibacter sp.]
MIRFDNFLKVVKSCVLRPNCKFRVLEVTKSDNYTLITLEEVK